MLAFLNTPTFPVFSPPTYFNPAFILRFYLSFILLLSFIYCASEGCSNWQKQKQMVQGKKVIIVIMIVMMTPTPYIIE